MTGTQIEKPAKVENSQTDGPQKPELETTKKEGIVIAFGDLTPFLTDEGFFGDEHPKVKLINGKLIFDKKTLDEKEEEVKKGLKDAIDSGDEKKVERYLWYLLDREDDEEVRTVIENIRDATTKKDSSRLGAIEIALPFRTMAERQMLKDKIKKEIERYPITAQNGKPLTSEDIDIILVQKGDHFEFLIGSKKGIESIDISIESELEKNQYIPDYSKFAKDKSERDNTEIIIIPFKKSKTGTEPLASIVKIIKGTIDLPVVISQQEQDWEKEQKKKKSSSQPQPPSYAPPPPSVSPPTPSPRSNRGTSWSSSSN